MYPSQERTRDFNVRTQDILDRKEWVFSFACYFVFIPLPPLPAGVTFQCHYRVGLKKRGEEIQRQESKCTEANAVCLCFKLSGRTLTYAPFRRSNANARG